MKAKRFIPAVLALAGALCLVSSGGAAAKEIVRLLDNKRSETAKDPETKDYYRLYDIREPGEGEAEDFFPARPLICGEIYMDKKAAPQIAALFSLKIKPRISLQVCEASAPGGR